MSEKRKIRKSGGDQAKVTDAEVDQLLTNLTAVVKAESQILTNALEVEDGFQDHYGENIISPEISPEKYYAFNEQNNALNQCVTSMEVNIDGTGYDVVRADSQQIDDSEQETVEALEAWLKEVYPGVSLRTMRRQLRRHLEISGCGYIEVIRNASGEIIFFRTLDSRTMRMMRLGEPTIAQKTVNRGGQEVSIDVSVRERVFVQRIMGKKVYFKEYGSKRDLNKNTGKWSENGRLPAKDRASEIIYFTVNPSATSPYGVPRWLNQLPSVIGSRSAEELNLSFFDAGGIPPLMIFVAGGVLAEETRKQITAMLSGKAKDKLQGVVADVHSSGGTVDKSSKVDITVETFDSARQSDSMFENYDERCEKRIRCSFRLPPLFVGKADDYSYASVFASYTLGEAQVFQPERDEFDEIFNNTIMRELSGGEYEIKSRSLSVANSENKVEAIEVAAEFGVVSRNNLRAELNEASGLSIPMEEEDGPLEGRVTAEIAARTRAGGSSNDPNTNPDADGDGSITEDDEVVEVEVEAFEKSDLTAVSYLSELATVEAAKILKGATPDEGHGEAVRGLTEIEKGIFDVMVANRVYQVTDHDPDGMAELCGCAHHDPELDDEAA